MGRTQVSPLLRLTLETRSFHPYQRELLIHRSDLNVRLAHAANWGAAYLSGKSACPQYGRFFVGFSARELFARHPEGTR